MTDTKTPTHDLLINKATACITRFASKDLYRPALTGVYITNEEVAATDSYRLAIITLPKRSATGATAEDYPLIRGAKVAATVLDKPVLIEASALEEAVKSIKKSPLDILMNVAIEPHEDGGVTLHTTNLSTSRAITGETLNATHFPSYDRLMPKEEEDFAGWTCLNVEMLADFCAAAKQFAPGGAVAKFKVHKNPLKPSVFVVENANGQTMTYLQMPVRT